MGNGSKKRTGGGKRRPAARVRSRADQRRKFARAKSKPLQGGVEAIHEWVRKHADEMAAFIEKLVAVRTENPPGCNYRECADLLERTMHGAGLECERFEPEDAGAGKGDKDDSKDGAVCLQASHGSGQRTLYFHGHYDVVPAQSAEQFRPRREKHFLFGRGSCDMKGGLVAMLYAMRALKECRVELNGKVSLALVCDEETGGARGSAWLARQGFLGRDGVGMLTAEPTSGAVWNANRGAITLRIEARGKSAHVGLQRKGENAFERMHAVVARLLELKREVELRETGHRTGENDAQGSRKRANGGGPRNSILLVGGESGGGTNFNVVPDRCWFTVDRRINPEEDLETEKERLIGLLQTCRQEGIPLSWEILQEGRAASCDENGVLAQALAKNVIGVTGAPARFEMCPGLLEIRFYAEKGMPAYAYGPGLLSVAHGPKEYVDLRRVRDCALIYALTAAEMLGA